MHPVLQAAVDRLVLTHQVTLVVAYGSFATQTFDDASDVDLVAWAPVAAPIHDNTTVEGRELDAWVYPWAHPFDDPELVRVHPALCLVDTDGRYPDFEAAVAQTRATALRPLTAEAKAELTAWARKMLARAQAKTAEGLQRYHWLLSDAPELWCRFRDEPWEGPRKALARMRRVDPEGLSAYQDLLAGAPDADALEHWIARVIP